MHLFYCPNIDFNSPVLDEQESHHCVKVLRLQVGDSIHVADGKGNLYQANILHAHPKHCSFQIISTQSEVGLLNYQLIMAVAPTKHIDRFEWFIEKAVEIGVSEIYPIYCDHSERKVIKMDRIQSILVSAMKQSLSAFLPKLHNMISFNEFLKTDFNDSQRYIAHCYDLPRTPISQLDRHSESYTLCIGPEGDFSIPEIESAHSKGFAPISLGNRRLRTETAALYALQHIHFLKS